MGYAFLGPSGQALRAVRPAPNRDKPGLRLAYPNALSTALGKQFGDLAFQPQREAGLVILVRRSAIDNDIGDSAVCGHQWKRGGRMNRERGSQRNHEIRPPRRFAGALEGERIKTLSKTDRRRFQESSAVAKRRFATYSKCFKVRLRIASPMTGLTLHE